METIESIAHEDPEEPEPAVSGLPPSISVPGVSTGALRFMQEDELALDEQPEETSLEETPVAVAAEQTVIEVNINGHTAVEEGIVITTTTEVKPFYPSLGSYSYS